MSPPTSLRFSTLSGLHVQVVAIILPIFLEDKVAYWFKKKFLSCSLSGLISVIFLILIVKLAQSCPSLCDPYWLYRPRNSPGQNTGVGSRSFLQGICPTQGSNPGLPHCRCILYQLSHLGSPHSGWSVLIYLSNESLWSMRWLLLMSFEASFMELTVSWHEMLKWVLVQRVYK